MKQRTIEYVKLNHKKFATFIQYCEFAKHKIENIKEYNNKFTYYLDGYYMTFDKAVKDMKWYYMHSISELNLKKELRHG